MIRVDFYHLTRDSAESGAALIARNAVKAGERLLIVSADEGQRTAISKALWSLGEESFLANGLSDAEHADRQPVLISADTEPVNGARFLALADGQWREAASPFGRTFYLFDETTRVPARGVWKMLRDAGGKELHYWKQEAGRWIEAG